MSDRTQRRVCLLARAKKIKVKYPSSSRGNPDHKQSCLQANAAILRHDGLLNYLLMSQFCIVLFVRSVSAEVSNFYII